MRRFRIASTPAAWPSSSARSWSRAQRRLPSMMIATWRGQVDGIECNGRGRARSRPRAPAAAHQSALRAASGTLDLEDLLFLHATEAVDLADEPVGRLLERLELAVRLRPRRPSPSRSSFLRSSAASRRMFRISTRASSIRLWTTLTRSLRRSSVSGGMFSRTTVPSTFGTSPMSLFWIAFSIAPRTLRSHGWMTIWCGFGNADPGQLVERRLGPVVVDREALDEGRRGAAGPDPLEVALHRLDGARHPLLRGGLGLRAHAGTPPTALVAPEIRVPTGSPMATLVMLSGWLRSNTTIGRSFSMHSDTAAASRTLSWSLSRSAYCS